MSWNDLPREVRDAVYGMSSRVVSSVVCLEDDWAYVMHARKYCVGFFDVRGVWLSGGRFACDLPLEHIYDWREEEVMTLDTWFHFRLRKKQDGTLVTYDEEADGGSAWIEVGKAGEFRVANTSWNGVCKESSGVTRYNCVLFDHVRICGEGSVAGWDAGGVRVPGFLFRVYPSRMVTDVHKVPLDPFDVLWSPNMVAEEEEK